MNLESFFNPQSVAVVGVSNDFSKLGTAILKNIVESGFAGEVFGINPKIAGAKLLGKPCFANLKTIKTPLDIVVVVVPAKYVEVVIQDCIGNQAKNVIIISAGFNEVGQSVLETKIADQCRAHNINLLGPNCLGAIFPYVNLNVSFADGYPTKGKICFVSQSGAFCTAMLDWAAAKGIGFSHFISLGNKAGISENDILENLADDDNVELFAFYLESLQDGRRFMEQIKRVAPHKPVIILEPGKSVKAAEAASSHTGSLAPNSKILERAYQQAGAIQVFSMRVMFGLLETLNFNTCKTFGKKLAVLTNAGGVGVLTTDLSVSDNLELAELSSETKKKLAVALPAEANTHNPVDIIGDARADRYKTALEILIEDENVDQILVLLTPQSSTEIKKTAKLIGRIKNKTSKNIVASFIGGTKSSAGWPILREFKVPHFDFPVDATRVLGLLANRYQYQAGTASITHLTFKKDNQIELWLQAAKQKRWPSLPQSQVNYILEKYGFDFPKNCGFFDFEEALACAQSMFPGNVVLKISAPAALHKTDVQGVRLNVNTPEKFKSAWDALKNLIAIAGYQNAHIQVQEQIVQGTEVIMGLTRDENFGPVMLFGAGGIYTEVFKDTTVRVLPTHDFAAMIEETKVGKILQGVRGEAPKAIEPLIDVMQRLQRLVLDYPGILSVDINPAIITENRAVCVDFKILV